VVDCRTTARWAPAPCREVTPGLQRRLTFLAAAIRGRSWHDSARMAQELGCAMNDSAALNGIVARVVGRGPGATPSGDDVLVGALAVLTSRQAGGVGARAAASLRQVMLPFLSTTTDLSRHLLRQAARGLFSHDVHDLVAALMRASPPELG